MQIGIKTSRKDARTKFFSFKWKSTRFNIIANKKSQCNIPLYPRAASKSVKKNENEDISDEADDGDDDVDDGDDDDDDDETDDDNDDDDDDDDDDNDDDDDDSDPDPDAVENDFNEGESGGDSDLGEREGKVKRSAIFSALATSPIFWYAKQIFEDINFENIASSLFILSDNEFNVLSSMSALTGSLSSINNSALL